MRCFNIGFYVTKDRNERIRLMEESFKKEYRILQYGDYYEVEYTRIEWGPNYYDNKIVWEYGFGPFSSKEAALKAIEKSKMFDQEPIIHEVK